MPAADSRRARENRQSLFGKLRTRTRGAEVQRNNGAGGSSDIEGKAAMGSGERAGKRASFNGTVERDGRGLKRSHSERSEESPTESLITLDELCDPNFDCEIPRVRSG